MSLANKLTILRIVLIPFFLVLLLTDIAGKWSGLAAAIVFVAAAVTDILDGYVARRQNTVSDFGKIFDPVADKLMMLAAILPLVMWQQMGMIPAFIIIGREFLVSGLRIITAVKGGEAIAASWLGKWKTITQDIAVVAILTESIWSLIIPLPLGIILLWISVGFTVWSTIDYYYQNRKVFSL